MDRKKYFQKHPDQKSYQYSFLEEMEARTNLVTFWLSFKKEEPNLKGIYIDELAEVYQSGFLPEYVWRKFYSDQWLDKPEGLRMDQFAMVILGMGLNSNSWDSLRNLIPENYSWYSSYSKH